MKKWKKNSHNEVLDGVGFYISFSHNPCGDIAAFKGDTDNGETALVTENPHKFYILNGDYRKEYEALVDKGLFACLEFFKANIENVSSWTMD